jgi:hypothetical protein
MTIKARVRAGRLVLDEPTDLPEGAEVELLSLDPGDWLDETDRAALLEALRESDVDVAAGRLVEAEEILRELRSRRGSPMAEAIAARDRTSTRWR